MGVRLMDIVGGEEEEEEEEEERERICKSWSIFLVDYCSSTIAHLAKFQSPISCREAALLQYNHKMLTLISIDGDIFGQPRLKRLWYR